MSLIKRVNFTCLQKGSYRNKKDKSVKYVSSKKKYLQPGDMPRKMIKPSMPRADSTNSNIIIQISTLSHLFHLRGSHYQELLIN